MNKTITLLLSVLCLYGCDRIIDHERITTIIIENKSSHTVEIKDNNGSDFAQKPINCVLHSGESYSDCRYDEGLLKPTVFTGFSCMVIFDDTVEIDHEKSTAHSICDDASYIIEISGRHDTESTCTYIFTDEDYDRAVAANAKTEKQ